MQKNKEKESNIRKMKAQLVFLCISLMLLTSACGKADGKESFGSSLKPETAEVYGDSVNMRGGGLAEGDESGLFYVWDGKLMYQENHKEAEVLDEYGAEYLCLTPKTLYYVSRDEEGTRGIYARENGASKKRELLLTTEARYLYEYDGFLYYINYPQGADICRLKIKDNSVETLAEGRFDSLLLTEDALFYRDYETKQYFRRAFLEDYTLKEAELWISYAEDIMPILDGEWIYYDLGDYFYHYKVSLTDRAMMGRHPKASTDMLIANGQKYEINRKTDLNTGEESTFTEELYIKLIGIAKNRLLYKAYEYTEEELLMEQPMAERTALYSYDMENGETKQLAETEKQMAFGTEEAVSYYDRLQRGELTLLKDNEMSFAAQFRTAEEWKQHDMDVDGDGVPERFLFSGAENATADDHGPSKKKSMLLHADWDGISLYQTDVTDAQEWYEPLEDNTILYQYAYELGGYGSTFYEVYSFEPGGKRVLLHSYQHVTAQLDEIAYDAEMDTLIERDQYYAAEEFTDEADWTAQVEAVLAKRVWKNGLQ